MSLAAVAAAITGTGAAHALPLIVDEDPELAAELEAARKRSVNILDTSGSSNPGLRTLQTLRELQERRPGFSFSNQPGLADGGGRMGVGSRGVVRPGIFDPNATGPNFAELGGAGLFGSGLNAEAIARERVPEFVSDQAAGVRARPQAAVDPEAVDPSARNMVRGSTYNVSGESTAPMEAKPGLLSTLLKFVREYRVAVIGSAALLLVVALAASMAGRHSR